MTISTVLNIKTMTFTTNALATLIFFTLSLAYVELTWDPESSYQSVCLTELCHKLKEDFSLFEGEQSKPVKVITMPLPSFAVLKT